MLRRFAKAVGVPVEELVAESKFTDGIRQAVYEEPLGRRYVIVNDNEQVHGV
jgi:hypothetical protein